MSIIKLVDDLPTDGITVSALRALDFVVPGEWNNLVGFKKTVREITGESESEKIQHISERALWIYNDQSQGYQDAIWVYQSLDKADVALGAAAMANKVGEKISFLGFFNKLTPSADTTQALDLSIKIVAELVAFCKLNGMPTMDSLGDFSAALAEEYSGPALMRMVALVCFDGLIPLGPDFLDRVGDIIGGMSSAGLARNPLFQKVNDLIPGDGTQGKLDFIGNSFDSVRGWMSDLVSSRGLDPEMITNSLQNFVDIADDKLDYLAAFIDMTTNYFEHTGIQTVARRLILQAAEEV
ncbi:hypothetical protein [Okeania sp.]|uniref:hypothetical protein n=1 Tax=Okeania sp. TaxID=3100323 RepID=UPI002B4B4B6C|nr:hypothetical protein [Okeania sp.]MEB3340541.1 hypothetical protein [Okeania sp.]